MIYYLHTDTEQAMWQALSSAGLAHQIDTENGPMWQPIKPPVIALDMIGTIHAPTGQTLTDEEGNPYPEMAPLPGFHANLKAPEGIEGLPAIEPPSTPYRKWFGD